jgi:hypothetical protein
MFNPSESNSIYTHQISKLFRYRALRIRSLTLIFGKLGNSAAEVVSMTFLGVDILKIDNHLMIWNA